MSRPMPPAQRNLSLTEELEKLEQSITLTLQEIDSNFSKAHRIITTSILPLVEQYGEHSKAVWEASKFWKQFFEASANVSLSGYEELANDDDPSAAEGTTVDDDTVVTATDVDATPRPRSSGRESALGRQEDDTSLLTDDGDGDVSGSTPRPPRTKTIGQVSTPARPQFAGLHSPYEALKREMMREADPHHPDTGGGYEDEESSAFEESESELLFRQKTARLPDMSMTPHASLEGGLATRAVPGAAGRAGESPAHPPNADRLLHRVLDKNYRLQATPHRPAARGTSPARWKVTEKEKDDGPADKGKQRKPWEDSPMSSPEMAPPTLRSAAFMSPVRAAYRGGQAQARNAGPRTPGVSVQTPATGRKTRDVFGEQSGARDDKADEITWDSDSDEDVYAGMSPPKTIQFAMPASRLLQTPAREASKRIVEDILLTAGAGPDESSEYSPTMVKMNQNILDDSF
ncbi:hypothetical protein RB598_001613 [Gaeumannomyces tritici]